MNAAAREQWRRSARLRTLPARAALALEVAAVYAFTWRAARSRPLPEALARVRDRPLALAPGPRQLQGGPERLARVTTRVLARLPTDTRCLMQSLTLSALLARRGWPSSVVIGVTAGETFGAHAWVELEGRPLLPPGGSGFERLVEL